MILSDTDRHVRGHNLRLRVQSHLPPWVGIRPVTITIFVCMIYCAEVINDNIVKLCHCDDEILA